jgi:ribonuclease HI
MGKKYYAVKIGKNAGIYRTWEECKKQVEGVSGAVYKSFKNLQDAELFISRDEVKNRRDYVFNK